MKIWIDILTPKQLLFFEPIIEKLSKNHKILCTSRSYGEVYKLAKIRKSNLVFVGKHGGGFKKTKLKASVNRISKLIPKITKFAPDLAISFCSPEAARISFGLGVKHIAFCDSPHAEAVMRLTIPLIQKLLIPWVIQKNEFTKFGINQKNITQYQAIDAAITIKRKTKQISKLPLDKSAKNIVIRIEEEQAAYTSRSEKIIPIIREITNEFTDKKIVVLVRYDEQKKNLKRIFGKKITILNMKYDGKIILELTDVFIGSGGTMTAESALFGVPTISYNAIPNIVEKFLVKQKLVRRENNPRKISKIVKKWIDLPKKNFEKRAKKVIQSMDDPYQLLLKEIRT